MVKEEAGAGRRNAENIDPAVEVGFGEEVVLVEEAYLVQDEPEHNGGAYLCLHEIPPPQTSMVGAERWPYLQELSACLGAARILLAKVHSLGGVWFQVRNCGLGLL